MRRATVLTLAAFLFLALGCAAPRRANGPSRNAGVISIAKGNAGGAQSVSMSSACDEGRLGAAVDAQTAEGLRLVDVCLSGAGPGATTSVATMAAVKNTLRLGPEKMLTADALARDLEAAYATGLIDQVEATARQAKELSGGGGSIVLFLAVRERPRIASIAFDGLKLLTNDPTSAFPKTGTPLNREALNAAAEKLRAGYVDEGFDEATVKYEIAPADAADQVRVKVVVNEGMRARIGKVVFDGAHGGREVPLRKAVELEDGEPLSDDKLDRAALLISAFYYDNGYLLVEVKPRKHAKNASTGAVTITYPIVENAIFRIGKITVRNTDPATEKDILSNLQVKPSEIFNRAKLVADLQAIEARTRQRGTPLHAEPQTDIDKKAGLVNLTLVMGEAP